jgi:hypothetical protein
MTISVNYQKRKNINLFNKFQTNKRINLASVQNYIPIYDRFFSLNNTNWNSINLNHQWAISDIKDSCKLGKNKDDNDDNEHIFNCKLKHISDDDDISNTQKVFIKMAPLLDPFKYLVGKYNYNDSQLFNLPSIDKSIKVHPKISDPNNSSFIDGFFCFLSSKILHDHQFIHGLDYYGSFLAIKNEYKINIIDDIDYLVQSDFFNKQKGILFNVEDYSHLITTNEVKSLQPIKISTSLKSVLSVKSIDDNIFENIFDNGQDVVSLNDIKNIGVELVDITNSNCFDVSNQNKSETLRSGSTCSSRTSHTDDNDFTSLQNDIEDDIENDIEDDIEDETLDENISKKTSSEDITTDLKEDVDEDSNEEWEDDDSDLSTIEEESIILTFPKFPVQLICMENCENTFDDLIINESLSDDEWFSALMQIIMILITYQKMFSFTHNDLHTNNVMYIPTNKKFIYYTYKKKTYKVPTFGKIYKIIDFGRAIYKFNGKLFCSDSFQTGGDAATQYNTEPYFNDKKPRLEPNFSFDLCRLACSIFDYIVDDFEMIKNISECSPLVKLIVEWCVDDNGINMLYKNNGIERYPDFKLYKMIARYVHKHTPQAQLERKEFNKYLVTNKNIPKNEFIINIDDLPIYV